MSSAAVDSAPRQQPSLLLTLPAELRNIIYLHILRQPSSSRAVSARQHHAERHDRSSEQRFCANILLTCRQANQEASCILYGQNIFVAHESLLATLPSMLLTIYPAYTLTRPVVQRRAIGQIKRFYLRVRLDTDPRYTARQVEESFTGAEELDIEVFQAMFDSCSLAVMSLFEGVRGVRRATVRGSVGDGRYAAWLASTMMMTPGTLAIPDEHIVEELERQKPYSWSIVRHQRVNSGHQ